MNRRKNSKPRTSSKVGYVHTTLTLIIALLIFGVFVVQHLIISENPERKGISADPANQINIELDEPKLIKDGESLLCIEDTEGGLRIHRDTDGDSLANRTGVAMYLSDFDELHISSEHDIPKGMKQKDLRECL